MPSDKDYGEKRRCEFVEQLKKTSGIVLEHVKGVIYRTPLEAKVGIPFATEREQDRWF